nr:hypothetical protein [Tanacetum cinerariifolium]
MMVKHFKKVSLYLPEYAFLSGKAEVLLSAIIATGIIWSHYSMLITHEGIVCLRKMLIAQLIRKLELPSQKFPDDLGFAALHVATRKKRAKNVVPAKWSNNNVTK